MMLRVIARIANDRTREVRSHDGTPVCRDVGWWVEVPICRASRAGPQLVWGRQVSIKIKSEDN